MIDEARDVAADVGVATPVAVTASISPTPDASFHSNHACSSKQEPAPLRDIPVETNNPTAGNPAPLAALAAHNAQFFKAIAAQAAAALNALNARTTNSKPENENQSLTTYH